MALRQGKWLCSQKPAELLTITSGYLCRAKMASHIMSYSKIGKIVSTHGLEGKVVLRHNLEEKNAFNKIPHLFIEVRRESYIPYFIEERKVLNHDEILLKLDDVSSLEDAKTLSGKSVFLEEEVFARLKPKAVSPGMIGFSVTDKQAGLLGVIEDLFETPGQVLATVQYKGKEIMVPLIDATIVSIDGSRRMVYVNLPDGLLDIYL